MYDINRLRLLDKAIIGVILVATVAFGALVEIRSVYLSTRKTDVGCYFRAAWAYRTDTNIYDVPDDNGWHYAYPPAFAILMAPFADAPKGFEQLPIAFPYKVSVAIWYLISVICLAWGIHILAKAVEDTSAEGSFLSSYPPGSRPWWWLRLVPFGICLPAIGSTFSRGQVNTIVLLSIAGFAAETIRNRRGRAGLWLSVGICLKVIPAFLLILPLVRRDLRTLGYSALGMFIGLAVIPTVGMGPERAWESSRYFLVHTIAPGLGEAGTGTMAKELTGMNVTDNQSFQAIIHNLKYWSNLPRPRQADESTKLLHVSLAGLMTLVSFLAVRRWADRRFSDMFLIGNLTMIMFMASPVCHHHYFALAVPLVLTLVAVEMENRSDLKFGISMSILVLIQMAMEILPKIPALEKLRDAGVTLESGVILWGWGVATCWQLKSATVTIGQQPIVEERLRTAA